LLGRRWPKGAAEAIRVVLLGSPFGEKNGEVDFCRFLGGGVRRGKRERWDVENAPFAVAKKNASKKSARLSLKALYLLKPSPI
jgi:hypothetical protein